MSKRTSTQPQEPARRVPQLWTPEEDRLLKRLYRAGRSDPEISARMERSPSSVEGRRRFLGLVKESAGTPSTADLEYRAKPKPTPDKPDLFALWDRRNTALRERLRAQGQLADA